ncbi:hypothetical protein ACE3MQ_24880 [Paenibacillus lentus]|uniref:hypothetical protein n=1 Tax=Paenibacillus lentus TaxID=1338368 RepID=UPI00365FEAA2
MKYHFKGIVRGGFSENQAVGLHEPAVMEFEGDNLHEILWGLAIDGWICILKVNGRRIKNVMMYLKRNGLDPHDYMRFAADGSYQA